MFAKVLLDAGLGAPTDEEDLLAGEADFGGVEQYRLIRPGSHGGCLDGHVGLIARDMQLSQSGPTLSEVLESVLEHEAEEG